MQKIALGSLGIAMMVMVVFLTWRVFTLLRERQELREELIRRSVSFPERRFGEGGEDLDR